MGTLTRKFANNFTVGGVYKPAAINNASLNNVTDIPAAAKGKLTLISSQTASASASISFTSGIDSTYHTYVFKFVNMHPATDNVQFMHNASIDSGSNYNVTKTNTMFEAEHDEAGTGATLNYITAHDIAQGTGNAKFTYNVGNDNDQSVTGCMWFFNPSSTVFVKHFITVVSNCHNANYEKNTYTAGYYNTTSAVNAVRFQMSSGNIDAGTIYMYGVGA
jgi:hypothetical protein